MEQIFNHVITGIISIALAYLISDYNKLKYRVKKLENELKQKNGNA